MAEQTPKHFYEASTFDVASFLVGVPSVTPDVHDQVWEATQQFADTIGIDIPDRSAVLEPMTSVDHVGEAASLHYQKLLPCMPLLGKLAVSPLRIFKRLPAPELQLPPIMGLEVPTIFQPRFDYPEEAQNSEVMVV